MKSDRHWERIGKNPHHGVCLPLFALRSKKSCGIGEFTDLFPLLDWCKVVGFDTLQLLPLYDTGDDPSPYNCLSSLALHPIYLGLSHLPEAGELAKLLSDFAPLTDLERIAIPEVMRQKMGWLYRYFQKRYPTVSRTPAYQTFLAENPWLTPYATFKALKSEYGGKHWRDWPPHATADEEPRSFYTFLQYLCFEQMKQVKSYAEQLKIHLFGDMPILLSPDSADVWAEPELFDLTLAAGAPPDLYNTLGQKWGFPLFRWDNDRAQHFRWWRRRLNALTPLFHLYRLDHVVGFFRIWGIPEGKKAKEGFFVPSERPLWLPQGRELLSLFLDTSPLLPIAEDLGTIPEEVGPTLREFGIPGTKVIRWERRWDTDKSYIPYQDYEPLSLTTLSTPDSEPLSLWWQNCPEEAIPFAHFKQWDYRPTLNSAERKELLFDAHHTASLFHINLLSEYLSLFPELSWETPAQERINIPGTLLPTNWTYRFRPTLEELLAHSGLREAVSEIVR